MKKELFNDGKFKIEIETDENEYELSEFIDGEWDFLNRFDKYENAQKATERRKEQKKRKIEPLDCIYEEYGEYKEAKLTSVNFYPLSYGDSLFEGRITFMDDTSRQKIRNIPLKNTLENKSNVEKIKKLKEELKQTKESLIHFTEEELKKHFLENET